MADSTPPAHKKVESVKAPVVPQATPPLPKAATTLENRDKAHEK
jgi:hypothetical protein